jgi:predicted XRE-type DNA-binding protein
MGSKFKSEFIAELQEEAGQQKVAVKAALVAALAARVKALGVTQEAVAARLGLYQPDVSRLLKGPSWHFSVWKLIRFLGLLGQNVEIVVGLSAEAGKAGRVTVSSRAAEKG